MGSDPGSFVSVSVYWVGVMGGWFSGVGERDGMRVESEEGRSEEEGG